MFRFKYCNNLLEFGQWVPNHRNSGIFLPSSNKKKTLKCISSNGFKNKISQQDYSSTYQSTKDFKATNIYMNDTIIQVHNFKDVYISHITNFCEWNKNCIHHEK